MSVTEAQIKENLAEIHAAELEVLEQKKKIVALKKALPKIPVDDYNFSLPNNKEVSLAELFGDKEDLIVVHNMGRSCPYCTLWADGYNGLVDHLNNRAAFVVCSPEPPEKQAALAAERNWKFKMISSHQNTFAKDMCFEAKDGSPLPGVTTFKKSSNGEILRIASAPFGPGDDFCSAWHFFDLLEEGSKGWAPKYSY